MTLAFHPLAEIFPLVDGPEFDDLVEDIRLNGLRDPIVIHQNSILDGRNRYRALIALRDSAAPRGPGWGVYEREPVTEEDLDPADGQSWFERYSVMLCGEPLAFVISKNLKRRHLNESQRGMVAANLATMRQGERTDLEPSANLQKVAQSEAAKRLNVSPRTVADSVKVRNEGHDELRRAVEQGHLAVSAAAKAVSLDPETQRKIADEAKAGRPNVVRTMIKQEARAAREHDLGQRQMAAPRGKFGVILEDFEWDHTTWSDAGRDRAAENHYPVSRDAHSAAEIVARTKDRFDCAADDCVCFMWATLQHLAIAIDVLRLRGFEYRSSYAWGKDKIGLGFWSREKHEILLIGVKGKIDCPAPGTQRDSLIIAPRGAHSAKPECFLEMIEQYFPTLPKIELNRRGPPRKGWSAWGNEALPEEFDSQTGELTETAEDSRQSVPASEPACADSSAPQPPARAGSLGDDDFPDIPQEFRLDANNRASWMGPLV